MATDPLSQTVRRFAGQLAGRESNDLPDRELLLRYARGKRGREAEEAFAALLARHGPMVWGVCRRVLGNAADADDAFQAAFLVLARRADDLGALGSLAGWLHGVAVRVSRKARVAAARRRAREREADTVARDNPTTDLDWADLRPVIDEELARLGEKYQAPIALCYLEGRTQQEAAALLGWPEGTVSGRLHRGKELLRERLARRGVACSAATIGVLLLTRAADAGPIPAELFATTLRLAVGETPSTAVAALAAGMRRSVLPWVLGAAVACAAAAACGSSPARPSPGPTRAASRRTSRCASARARRSSRRRSRRTGGSPPAGPARTFASGPPTGS
jgi:RNA polymerase sigma-70 factor (ECF subfamily)